MAATMNFFRAQDEARGRTTKLVVLLVLAILVLTGTLYVLAVLGQGELLESGELEWFQPKLFLATSGVALAVILGGVFWASNLSHPWVKRFFTVIPALLLCYFLPSLLTTFGLVDPEESRLYFIASRFLLPAAQ